MENSNIKRIKILSGIDANISSIFKKDKYIIPLYQRAFAWEHTEIVQMIEDIENFNTNNYSLGTLIVNERKDGKYEVIDGQQRLTALYLLLTVLKIPFDRGAVSFEYRQKSDDTLTKLKNAEQTDWRQNADIGILAGFDVVSKKIGNKNENVAKLKRQLKKVNIVRVQVPPNTDLNKYFEIMNNRGEQLEQQDIVKSHLIEMIDGKAEKDAFARIWEACSDMSGYVQMHLEKREREYYFGNYWDWFNNPACYYLSTGKTDQIKERTISEIIKSADVTLIDTDNAEQSDEDNIRFESFITFRHFLLHVLKIFETEEMGEYELENEWNGELIDDKKLIQRFEEAFSQKQDENDAVQRFGLCLLHCRFLYDNFMLKREFNGDDTEGKWSLKTLRTTRQKKYGNLSAYYIDVKNGMESRMLQSMLRVTYTSPLVMHWVTDFLAWLYFNEYDSTDAVERLENFAKEQVRSRYLEEGNNSAGLNTSHIVFNYLDYLLWQESRSTDFQYEFRNSVEHWYPQIPIDSNVNWNEKALHHFGNLCLVSSGLNSKFSNNLPLAKKANFRNDIEKQSLKLQIMVKETSDADAWTEETAIAHGEKMIAKLIKAVYE